MDTKLREKKTKMAISILFRGTIGGYRVEVTWLRR
jgi:hypothetical protein